MKFYTRMPAGLQPYFKQELYHYRQALAAGAYSTAWLALERAHILGQYYPAAHTHVHLLMLGFGMRTKNIREVMGQIPRIVLGFVGSWLGKVPVGNTGGANVPILQKMEIPADLKNILQPYHP